MIYLDRELNVPLYEQIYQSIKNDILSGKLPGGARLPATRRLATDLVVGRNTVENAYQQLLVEGYVSSRVGSGYTVNTLSLPQNMGTGWQYIPEEKEPEPEPVKTKAPEEELRYDFRIIRLDNGVFPTTDFKRCLIEALKGLNEGPIFEYPSRQGDLSLRKAICQHLYAARGIEADPENMVITCGHQYSLDVICTLLEGKKLRVAMEDPGYAGANALFKLRKVKISPIPVERDGADMSALKRSKANLLYLTPSHQYPTGAVLSIQKRLQAVEWAARSGGYIIENDYDSELRYNTRPIPSLYAMDRSQRVIYIGSLSRPISLELGLGYMILPPELMEDYRNLYSLHYNSVPPIVQQAVACYIDSGDCARHLDRYRVACRKKHDRMLAETSRIFGERVKVTAAGGGLHLLFRVEAGYSDEELIRRARDVGVRVYSIQNAWLQEETRIPGQVLLGYGGIAIEDIAPALELLQKAWFGGKDD